MVGRVFASRVMSGLMAWRRPIAGLTTTASAASFAGAVFAQDLMGRPTDKALGLQPSNSILRDQAAFFHDWVLLPIIVVISLFVLALLVYVALKFNAKANPTPDRFTHNTPIEVVWTVAPVVILAFIAIFSFRLLYAYHDMPKPDVTVKVTGNQWYWNYEYPDMGGYAFDSNPLTEAKAAAQGAGLYRLAVDNPMVVPVGKTVQVLATGADVLHAFFVPAFGIQTTTIPGRVNTVWFKAEREGTFYGQCNELCGVNHSFMPIQINVVSQADYDAWVAAHSKKAPVTVAAATPAPVAAAPADAAAPAVDAATPATAAPAAATAPAKS
ncbi:cytochrome c oxidase subunit II [soil metagenome]